MPAQLTPLPAPDQAPVAARHQKITISVMFGNGRYRARCIALGITAEDVLTESTAVRKLARYHFGRVEFKLTEIRPGVWTAESLEVES